MLDVSLLKDPVFMLIGISNVFGMAGLYVPFVYLVDAATINVSKNNYKFNSILIFPLYHFRRALITIPHHSLFQLLV